jgi:hypothetical protein
MNSLFFWFSIWSIIGGLVPALLVAGTLWSDPRYKMTTRVIFGVILGPSMWIVQILAGAVAGVMFCLHALKPMKIPPFPPIRKPAEQKPPAPAMAAKS